MIFEQVLFLIGVMQSACEYRVSFTITYTMKTLFTAFQVFSALRVAALWNRSYLLLLFVFSLDMIPFGTNLVRLILYTNSACLFHLSSMVLLDQCTNTSAHLSWMAILVSKSSSFRTMCT
jgi:hypothetical protein